jgi:hypothetical protein
MVFEVLSPTSGRIDRIVKLRGYRAVPSIRRYVILEHASVGLIVLTRTSSDEDWTATVLTAEDTLRMPEIAAEIPVADFYKGVELAAVPDDDASKPPA